MARNDRKSDDLTIALAGNPNVGKSTVFNGITGMHQHTGNWTGKTVALAEGRAALEGKGLRLVDLPGTYSLMAHSAEEEVARDFICFAEHDATVVVCDATCLERNLNLALQIIEAEPHTVICVNLLDEARRKGITVDLACLSRTLGAPVVGVVARKEKTLSALLYSVIREAEKPAASTFAVDYGAELEQAIAPLEQLLSQRSFGRLSPRFLACRLLENDPSMMAALRAHFGEALFDETLSQALTSVKDRLAAEGMDEEKLRDQMVSAILHHAHKVAEKAVTHPQKANGFDRKLDRLLTGKWTAYPFMLALLALVFFITITGANYPSDWLSRGFAGLGELLRAGLLAIATPPWLTGLLIDGIYRVLSTVVSVMLPPMAIFFPLFTLLEDMGYLPRIAYNLDRPFCNCRACGKQSLTMCMGFGCNAVGVTGCRIIDSPRERILAVLTNSFVPCNGRFPTMITVITVFLAGSLAGVWGTALVSLFLTFFVLLGILMTFVATRLLSSTLLRGAPSAFTLELPPYRTPQIGKILIRSVFDRTLFVLGRAVVVAAPAGALIYLLANVQMGGQSLLAHTAVFLDPLGHLLGLDGAILLGFILGFPANEIVLPIVLMIYLSQGAMPALGGMAEIGTVLLANGWTAVTAVCFILFSLMHWPCSTTVLTVKKETGSWRWTAVAVLLPTLFGIVACLLVNGVAQLFGGI